MLTPECLVSTKRSHILKHRLKVYFSFDDNGVVANNVELANTAQKS